MRFRLTLRKLLIGILDFDGKEWVFSYSDQFRSQPKLRTLAQFPKIEGTYKASKLWPFFSLRIPGLKQPEIIKIMASEGIDPTDEAKLLARFGKRCIKDPFILTKD